MDSNMASEGPEFLEDIYSDEPNGFPSTERLQESIDDVDSDVEPESRIRITKTLDSIEVAGSLTCIYMTRVGQAKI
jgi:hypothetical protein